MNAVKLIVDVGAEEEHAFIVKALPLANAMGLVAKCLENGGADLERLEAAIMDALIVLWVCPVGNASRAARQSMTVAALCTLLRLEQDPVEPWDSMEKVLNDIVDQVTHWCMRLTKQAGVPDDVELVKNHERELREDIDCWRKALDWSALGTPLAVTRQLWDSIDDGTDLSVTRGRLTMRWTVSLVAVLARLAVKDERIASLERLVYQEEIGRVLS